MHASPGLMHLAEPIEDNDTTKYIRVFDMGRKVEVRNIRAYASRPRRLPPPPSHSVHLIGFYTDTFRAA